VAENNIQTVKEYGSLIQRESLRMTQMIHNLLHLARIGLDKIPFESVDLNALLAQVTDTVQGLLSMHKASIIIVQSLPTIQGCPTRLHELFQNLIENAIKFRSPEALPQVEIGCDESETHWNIFVKDNGIGIAPKYQKHIFGLFRQLNQTAEGSGIGLALVSRIAQMHQAEVSVESAGINTGSTFWIHFRKGAHLS
jgi:signal transduction histidine kinase